MSRAIRRAMVLAAGRGTRLRPLSDERPKPLFPLGPLTILHYPLLMLRQAGVREVMMNLHHMGGQIRERFGAGGDLGLSIHFSEEQPELLGTGGGIKRARDFLEGGPFVVVNGDTISDVDLPSAIEEHERSGAAATMVLAEAPADGKEYGLVAVDEDMRVRDIAGRAGWRGRPARLGHFCGIHVIEPRIFDLMPVTDIFCINADVYPRLLAAGETIRACFLARSFSDVGTPARYLATAEALLDGRLQPDYAGGPGWLRSAGAVERSPGIWISAGARIDPAAVLQAPLYVGENAAVEAGARVGPYALLGSASRAAAGSAIAHTILWEGAVAPEGAVLERTILTSSRRVAVDPAVNLE
ncbi:MAG: NDP-sugar synthase [Deltaproteobacteria bacterium]|nr:NDP-sugar synthase [Deltaproteobacteria bacterium]